MHSFCCEIAHMLKLEYNGNVYKLSINWYKHQFNMNKIFMEIFFK